MFTLRWKSTVFLWMSDEMGKCTRAENAGKRRLDLESTKEHSPRTTRLLIYAACKSPIEGSQRLCMSDGSHVGLQRAEKASASRVWQASKASCLPNPTCTSQKIFPGNDVYDMIYCVLVNCVWMILGFLFRRRTTLSTYMLTPNADTTITPQAYVVRSLIQIF